MFPIYYMRARAVLSQQTHTLVQVLSLFEEVEVGLIAQHHLVGTVERAYSARINLITVADVDAVEIDSEHHAYTIRGAVHHAAIEFVLGSVVHQTGTHVATPLAQVGTQQGIGGHCILRIAEAELVSAHGVERS